MLIGRLVVEVGYWCCGEGSTHGGPADGQGLGDLAEARPGFTQPVGFGEAIWGDDSWPASASTTGPGGGEAGVGAFSNEVGFRLGEGSENIEDRPRGGGGGVDGLGQRADADVPRC